MKDLVPSIYPGIDLLGRAFPEGDGMTCFVLGCTRPLLLTRSWRGGPTLHACAEHEALLPRSRPNAAAPRQGVLL